jgi:hypothetical protein
MKKRDLIYFAFFLAILAFTFRSLIAGIATNLLDWYDYPLVVWLINNNLDKVIALNFPGIFNTNILYPHPNTLLLTETFFTQTFLALPFRFVSNNPLFIFNATFLLNFVLNYIAAYIFWKEIFKKRELAFLGSLLTVFSSFFHAQLGHFQLQSYWPSLFSLYFIIRNGGKHHLKNLILSGVFLAIQFLASVYVAVFLIASICLYFLSLVFLNHKLFQSIKNLAVILGTFLIICSPVIVGYLKVQKEYNVQRNYGEYVSYSAHLSDYLFSGGIKSAIHSSVLVNKWNSFNKHNIGEGALFPGFLLTTLGLLGIFYSKEKRGMTLFFLFLTGTGFIFSLGPRINFNGTYAEIPLPYHLLLKYVPFIDVIRAPARWAFLFYTGLTFFALKYLSKKSFGIPIFLLLTVFIILEYIPLNIQARSETYIHEKDQILKDICSKETKVVLEIPITHFDAGDSIFTGLSYITKTILASSYHKCNLVNGYTSYDLPSIQILKNSIYDKKSLQNPEKFAQVLKSSNADILVVNDNFLIPEIKDDLLKVVEKLVKQGYLIPYGEGVYQIWISAQ